MLYQKECAKHFNDYFGAAELDRDVNAFINSLKARVRRGELVNYKIDKIDEDCGNWYSHEFGMRDFFFRATVYYMITFYRR